jgi:ABC-type Mn2+/Zn2+ transport system ATPase subunit
MNGEPSDNVRTSSLRITEIVFRTGSSPSDQPLHLPVGNVTILVGPNNAGKSLALREIEFACTRLHVAGLTPANAISPQVVLGVALDLPQAIEEVMDLMRPFKHPAEQPPYAPSNEQ